MGYTIPITRATGYKILASADWNPFVVDNGVYFKSRTDLIRQDNLTAIVDPSVTDDDTTGYSVLSQWLNTVTEVAFVCLDDTTGNAFWLPFTTATTGIDSAQFNTSFTPGAHSPGLTYWDPATGYLSIDMLGTVVTLSVGGEESMYARNNSGGAIADGEVVYLDGALAGYPTIALALADVVATSDMIGVTTQGIANNALGYVTTFGLVRGLDTSAFSAGDSLWLSATTPGELVNTMPVSPNIAIFVGRVIASDDPDGIIIVADTRVPPSLTQITDVGTAANVANYFLATPDTTPDGFYSGRAIVANDIPDLPASKITSGQLILEQGGTEADLSATGPGSLVQTSSGAAVTVETLDETRGGTGQTTYTKGDIVAATGATTLVKLPVGTDDQVLTADAAEATGLKWADGGGGTVDAADVTYTPDDVNDWNGDVDPGNANDALDQLASRAVNENAINLNQGVSNLSTTSLTFVDVSATLYSITMTVRTTTVLVLVNVGWTHTLSTNILYLDITIDGSRYTSVTNGLYDDQRDRANFATLALLIPVSVGEHTFRLQYKTNGGTVSIKQNVRASQFAVMEV